MAPPGSPDVQCGPVGQRSQEIAGGLHHQAAGARGPEDEAERARELATQPSRQPASLEVIAEEDVVTVGAPQRQGGKLARIELGIAQFADHGIHVGGSGLVEPDAVGGTSLPARTMTLGFFGNDAGNEDA